MLAADCELSILRPRAENGAVGGKWAARSEGMRKSDPARGAVVYYSVGWMKSANLVCEFSAVVILSHYCGVIFLGIRDWSGAFVVL